MGNISCSSPVTIFKGIQYKLPSNLRPTTCKCIRTMSGTDMTRGISHRHDYMPAPDDAMCSPSGELYSCTHRSIEMAG